jgi:hypothetical protein
LFTFVCFPGGDDSDDRIVLAIAMTYDENAKSETHTQHDEAVLVLRMIGIEVSDSVLVEKDRLGFLE